MRNHIAYGVVVIIFLCVVAQAQTPQERAATAIDYYISRWWDTKNISFAGADWWQMANSVEALCNYMLYTGNLTYLDYVEEIYSVQTDSHIILSTAFDDIGWWGIAWGKAYQLTGDDKYLARSKLCFESVVIKGWSDDVCKGGLWWSMAYLYKNAITNELFLVNAMHLSTQIANNSAYYLDWAQREWAWFNQSTMINAQSLINDGLKRHIFGPCTNNGETEWTYNQGVILGGLSMLYNATKEPSLLAQAIAIGNAATTTLVHPNTDIMRESCEPDGCDFDSELFKGIFARYICHLDDTVRAVTGERRYTGWIVNNSQSLFDYGQGSAGEYGVSWMGPWTEGTSTPMTQLAAIELFNCAMHIALDP